MKVKNKAAVVPNGTLDSFIEFTKPKPVSLATSQEIRDRGSTFVANIFQAATPEEARSRIEYLKNVIHRSNPASHEIAAWRCMSLKHGRTGLMGPDDFELKTGSIDGGEQWAGGKVLKVMQAQSVIDAVVIVSRWYGGVMLGPTRFTHIETCTTEVCHEFKRTEELQDCKATLTTLDDLLTELRSELAQFTETDPKAAVNSTPDPRVDHNQQDVTARVPRQPNYSGMDVEKAKRLIRAREKLSKPSKSY
ncbi:ribosomal protein S5 domain 2-type protein [Infundibulicybe gibba]|nr:ribosomal protein S5 domain 2-type protein [Infundibulicybe gibba]